MVQNIQRIKYYGSIDHGDTIVFQHGIDWFLAYMDEYDVCYFAINLATGSFYRMLDISTIRDRYFPNEYDVFVSKLLFKKLQDEDATLNYEKKKFRIFDKLRSLIRR